MQKHKHTRTWLSVFGVSR